MTNQTFFIEVVGLSLYSILFKFVSLFSILSSVNGLHVCVCTILVIILVGALYTEKPSSFRKILSKDDLDTRSIQKKEASPLKPINLLCVQVDPSIEIIPGEFSYTIGSVNRERQLVAIFDNNNRNGKTIRRITSDSRKNKAIVRIGGTLTYCHVLVLPRISQGRPVINLSPSWFAFHSRRIKKTGNDFLVIGNNSINASNQIVSNNVVSSIRDILN